MVLYHLNTILYHLNPCVGLVNREYQCERFKDAQVHTYLPFQGRTCTPRRLVPTHPTERDFRARLSRPPAITVCRSSITSTAPVLANCRCSIGQTRAVKTGCGTPPPRKHVSIQHLNMYYTFRQVHLYIAVR